jgi:chemotaxis protein methyltransferase CheR
VDRSTDIELRLLIEAIYLKYSYDFRDYSGASVKRRVAHALRQFDCKTISALQERVLHDPTAFMQLLQFLTIPVSEMFRDPSHFLAIRQEVVPTAQDLSVDQDLDRRLQHGGGGVLHGHPAARGGAA